jgi:hypothetical protein
MILAFALIGAVVGFFPGGSFLLIPMEVYLLYKICTKHKAFDFPMFFLVAAALIGVSAFLKGLATFLQAIPVIGQFANSLVAFGFIVAFGNIAEHYYSRHPRPPN